MDQWFAWAVGIYFLGMILYGHYKGFLKLALSLSACILTLFLVQVTQPYITQFLKEDTSFHQWVGEQVAERIGLNRLSEQEMQMPAAQRVAIENLDLPEKWKEMLLENNNNEVYHLLGVQQFTEYVDNYTTGLLINTAGFILMFIIVFITMKLMIRWLDLIARLPVLYGLNHILGSLLGAVEALVLFWVFCLALPLFSSTHWGKELMTQMEASTWTAFLYHNNIISYFIKSAIWGLVF